MSPKLLASLMAVGLTAAACSGSSQAPPTTLAEAAGPGRLVLWNEDEIGIVTDGEIASVEASGEISQVTAARNGSLVWTSIENSPPQVAAVIYQDGARIELETPTVPFFYEWNPVGSRIAFLGNAPDGGGLVFGLIDVATETVTPLESPSPFFFDWSPDGDRLVAHVGGASLGIIDAATGEVDDLGEDSGRFPAPVWDDQGIVIVIEQGPTVSGGLEPVVLQQSSSVVTLLDPDDRTSVDLASIDGPVRLFPGPDGLALVAGAGDSQRIEVVDWTGEPVATLGTGAIDLAQWSPDGSTLLWTERRDGGELVPMTWSEGASSEYAGFRPSGVFATAYLPFWDQYERALSIWSPDSASFVLPTRSDDGPVVLVQPLEGASVEYVGWDMAAWMPSSTEG